MIVVRTLGTAEIQIGETRILPTSPRKFALLLYLVAERGSSTPRATLCDLIFPDQTRANAQHSLRELIYQFRQLGALLRADAHGIQLAHETADLDIEAFIADGTTTEAQLRHIARGFLPGYAPEHSEAFAEWFDAFKARSIFRLAKVIVAEIERSRDVSDWIKTELAARACLEIDSLNEAATLAMAQCLAVGGAKSQALALLDKYNLEVGDRSRELKLAPAVLRRRINEHLTEHAPSQSASPFVGRDGEMQLLRRELAMASRGESRCVWIVGEPGIGKTRLATEFCRLARLDGYHVADAAVQPHDVRRPYAAFADLLQSLLNARGALGVSPESLDLLRRIISGPSADATEFSYSLRESDAFSHTIAHSIVDLIDAVTSESTVVLSVDDFPYIDAMSQRVFEMLFSRGRRQRLLLVATARDLAIPVATNATTTNVIELGAIDASAATRFIGAFLEREAIAVDNELANWFTVTAAGHPLFLENLLAHHASTGERFAIPPSLSALLRRRIDALSDRASVALQTCSLLGRFATFDNLIAATGLPRFDLVQAANELERARLILIDGSTIRPTHSLVSDVVTQRMTPMQGRLLHQFCALTLEDRINGEQSAALVWEYAEHWYAAGNAPRAVAAIRRCANHAVEMGRAEAAAQMLARAVTLASSPQERTELAELLVAAAEVAMNSELVLQGLRALDRQQRSATHDDFEFVEFRAHTRVYRDNGGHDALLMKCVTAQEASANHRVTAAIHLLKYADSCLNSELSRRTIAALPAEVLEAANDVPRHEFSMIAQIALRDSDGAVASARKLLSAIDREPRREWLHYSLNAVLALYYGGAVDEAVKLAESRLHTAAAAEIPHLRMLFATFLWEYSRDMFDDERAKLYEAMIDQLACEFPSLGHQLPAQLARLGAALTDGDYPTARSIADRMIADGLLRGGIVRDRWRRIAECRLAQIRGEYVMTETDLQSLIEDAKQGLMTGGVCEAEAATACQHLLHTGRSTEASDFCRRFVSDYRTSRAPLTRCMADVRRALDAQLS